MTVCSPRFVNKSRQPQKDERIVLTVRLPPSIDKIKEFVNRTHFDMGFAKHTKGRNSPLNDDLLQYNAVPWCVGIPCVKSSL
jgi:hypothetical protein